MTTTATPPPPVRRRWPLWARLLLWTAGVVTALLGAAALWLAAVFSGGLDNLLSLPGPSEDEARVVRAQQQAEAALRSDSDTLLRVVAPALGSVPLATGSGSTCHEGQHNWKIDDPYDLQCHQMHVAVVPGGDVAGFRATALSLHAQLVADGWEPGDGYGASSVEDVLVEYWDLRVLEGRASPAALPGGSYSRDGRELTVDWVAASSSHYGWPVLATSDGRDVPSTEVNRLVEPGTWAAALVLRTEYFYE
jgi:hypothetical protein